tara:strand:- start:1014 stop:1412 length:399 start_codon:yes stop_codon:yes gene_type:complete
MFDELKLPSNRKFGLTFSFIFFIIFLYFFFTSDYYLSYLFLFFSIIFLFFGIIFPNYLSKLNKAWMMLGLLLGKIVNPIVLGIIYFGLFTPIGLFRKIIGKDELKLKPKNINSYWQQREKISITPESFKDQF